MGLRSHQRSLRRTFSASHVEGTGVASRFISLLLPWTIEEYPGRVRGLAEFCGVKPKTVEDWLYDRRPLPAHHALKMARYAHGQAAALTRLAAELNEVAAAREGADRSPRGFIRQQAESSVRRLG